LQKELRVGDFERVSLVTRLRDGSESSRNGKFLESGGASRFEFLLKADMQVQAFAPANGSLIFETYEATAEHGRGSLGVGFTLDAGVIATVRRAACHEILVDPCRGQLRAGHGPADEPSAATAGANVPSGMPGRRVIGHYERWEFPTVAQVVRTLAPEAVRVELRAELPFGCGFGMSGASALSTAYAIGGLFELDATAEDLALVAHEAEVDNATGRGDVGGQFNGGFMLKTKKGEPLKVEQLPIPEQTVYCRIFGPISTPDVLGDAAIMERVNTAGREALRQLRTLSEIDLDGLLFISREFAEASGLLRSSHVRRSITEAELAGGFASMVMLGEAVVSSVPIPGARAFRVVKNPARLLEVPAVRH
jgi:pantoate kinase